MPGQLAQNFTTKDFQQRCRISFLDCGDNIIRDADNQTFKATQISTNPPTIELELSCDFKHENPMTAAGTAPPAGA